MNRRVKFGLPALGLAICFLAVTLGGRAVSQGPVQADIEAFKVKREYRIRNLGEGDDKSSRRLYTVTGFTFWIEERELDGRSVAVFKIEEKTKEGEKVFSDITLDPKDLGMVRVERKTLSKTGKVMVHSIENYGESNEHFPKGTYHFSLMPLAATRMKLEKGAKQDAWFVFSPENKPMHIFMEVVDEERVTVPAGTFECMKVRVRIDTEEMMGGKSLLSRLMSAIFPDTHIWVEKAAPHSMIKTQGRSGGFSAPEQATELVKIEKAG